MLKNIPRDDVLRVVRQRGPTIPARIVKELGGDTFLIGAILSDLLNNKFLKCTFLKLGGSPFYYAPEQKSRLQELSQHLKGKEREAFEKIKSAKVLKDNEQEPSIRVALRMIKDFAKPVEVKTGQSQELFWKYFLVDNEEVKSIIKDKFMKKPEAVKQELKIEKALQPEEIKPVEETKPHEEPKPKKQEDPELKKSVSTLPREMKKQDAGGGFAEKIQKYFAKKNIEVLEKTAARKTEIEYIIRVPSSIGTMEYYCKAKDKKRCNDGDLASAYIQGQSKKLPVLFLTTGELTKKAKDMLHKEFKGLTANKI